MGNGLFVLGDVDIGSGGYPFQPELACARTIAVQKPHSLPCAQLYPAFFYDELDGRAEKTGFEMGIGISFPVPEFPVLRNAFMQEGRQVAGNIRVVAFIDGEAACRMGTEHGKYAVVPAAAFHRGVQSRSDIQHFFPSMRSNKELFHQSAFSWQEGQMPYRIM